MEPSTPSASAQPVTADATGPTGSPTGDLTVPAEAAKIPVGTYRTRITRDDLIAAGADNLSNAGTWTLIVTKGEYRLECKPVANPGQDCGNSPTNTNLMEIGPLRGTGNQAWFAEDMGRKATEVGCARRSQGGNGCGPESPYRFTWAQSKDGSITFSGFVGVGDTAGQDAGYVAYTLKPWTKIR